MRTEGDENRLKNSASPYLRSAARQPIDWYEWGEAAFARARAEQKPILLDIGAVWCHWCHVIDRESYENPEIAALINQMYVAVKVDRDERPDVDARYQAAISAISGQGGWPLTAFLTPEGKPFFGGTYFPPDDVANRPGFRRVLVSVADAFAKRRSEIDSSALTLEAAVAKSEMSEGARGDFDASLIDSIVENSMKMFDPTYGGFGHAPKFPHPAMVELLLERHKWPGAESLGTVIEKILSGMANGGFHDQLGGGFHRYSVDERWLVPHFEKMSYDNSELLKSYLHGYQALGTAHYRTVAEDVIFWVGEVLSDPQRGGFYASQDADQTLDDDGDYFTWTLAELRAALFPDEAAVMELYYHVGEVGEMQHNRAKNVLWIAESPAAIAAKLKRSEAQVSEIIARSKAKMLAARRLRQPTPTIDTTLYVAWNAMFISAYLEAARILGREDCRSFARKTLDLLLAEAWDEKRGFGHRAGGPHLEGSLDDQVFGASALLDAYEDTLESRYFSAAEQTMRAAVARFGDPENGGFFDRARDAAPMGGIEVRRKPLQDSPTPGANSVGAIVLDRLSAFTGEHLWREWAEKTLEAFAGRVPQYGLFAATYGLATLLHARRPLQVVITGAAGDQQAAALEKAAHEVYRYGKSVLRVIPERLRSATLPAALRETLPARTTANPAAFVCVETSCFPPVSDAASLKSLLAQAGIPTAAQAGNS